jgi:hypothetical protein
VQEPSFDNISDVDWENMRAKVPEEPLSWYCVSDTLVTPVKKERVAKCEAYLLLYMRV